MDEHEHSPARMRYTKFVHFVQNYRQIPHRCCLKKNQNAPRPSELLFAGCQNSTALNSLHYSIRSRVEVNFVDVCGYDTRGTGFSLCTHRATYVLLYSDTVRCPGDNSIKLGRTDASRQNSTTTNARSMSYRYTGVMLYQALCGVQRQL